MRNGRTRTRKLVIMVLIAFLIAASLSAAILFFNVNDHLDFRYTGQEGYEYGAYSWHEFNIIDGTSSFFYSFKSSDHQIGLLIARYNSSVHAWSWPSSNLLLNVTGTEITGRFDCPTEGSYSLILYGVTPPGGVSGLVDYEICRVPTQTFPTIYGYSIFICSMTVLITVLMSLCWKSERANIPGPEEEKIVAPIRFFITDYRNWIAMLIGAAIVSVVTIIRSITILNSFGAPYVQAVNSVGILLLIWGIIFGIAIIAVRSLPDELKSRVRVFFLKLWKITLRKRAS